MSSWAGSGAAVTPVLLHVFEGWGMLAVYVDGGTDMEAVFEEARGSGDRERLRKLAVRFLASVLLSLEPVHAQVGSDRQTE